MYILILLFLICLGDSKDCSLTCGGVQTTYDRSLCIDNCQFKIILGYTVGCTTVFFLIVFFLCCCKYYRYRCLWVIKREIRREFDMQKTREITSNLIKPANLEAETDNIAKSLKWTEKSHILCFFLNKSQIQMTIFANSIKTEKISSNHYTIYFEGKDRFDQYYCSGSILQNEDSVKLWFLKEYKYYENVNKVGMEDLLVYHAILNKTKKMYIGQWESRHERLGKKLSGKWFLSINEKYFKDRFESAHSLISFSSASL